MNTLFMFSIIVSVIFQIELVAAETVQNKWGMTLVKIHAGEFKMGLDDYDAAIMEVPVPKENSLRDELPQHTVRISQDFYIAQTEVTQQQWLSIMQNRPGPAEYWQQKNWKVLPVISVSWRMADRFIKEINKLDNQYRYRLPTEAEWEYVARAGSDEYTPVPIEDLDEYAWFINNSGDEQQVVATRKANAYGVHDMLGNVWEWTSDWYAADAYLTNRKVNPAGPQTGTAKVRRGGAYHCPIHLVRPGYRVANTPSVAFDVTGLRVVAEKR